MWGWLIAFGILFLLAMLPLGVSALYHADGPLVRVIIGPFRWTVFPGKKKEPKVEKKKTVNTQKSDKPAKKKESEKKGGSFTDFLPILKTVLDFLGDFRRKLRVKCLEMKLVMGGGDPCDLAVNYGKAWTVVGNLMPHLENLFVIQKRDIQVECDFIADQTIIYVRLDLTITLGRLLALLIRYGIPALSEYMKLKNKRKGGANT